MMAILSELRPEVRAVVEDYLAQLDQGTAAELTGYLVERVDGDTSLEEARRIIADIGPIEGEPAARGWRPPTWSRFAETLWDPRNPKVLVPNVFRLGWTINFGALAVKAGLIEPDAEDVPFANVPEPAFRTAAVVPTVLAGAVVLHYLARWDELPERLPSHWAWDGTPDRFQSKGAAAATDLGISVLGAAAAWLGTRGPRGAGIAAATAVAGVTAAATTVWRTADRRLGWAGPAFAAAVLAVPGSVLYALARAGREAEIRADLRHGSAQVRPAE